ncbi:MAG: Wzz/FepE/Etk N-terminal domain-containing protein [Anaerolineales bacterium]
MDDEIDLRRYWLALVRNWGLIAVLTVVAAAAAAGPRLLTPNQYEATALVSVSPPRNGLRLDDVNQSAVLPVRAYPDLALSNDVTAQVYAKASGRLPNGVDSPAKLAARLRVETTSDLTLLRFKVRDTDPQRAADITNAWAEVFAANSGRLYAQDQANLVLYQQQLDDARGQLKQADDALAAFQSSNLVGILTAQLTSQRDSLTDYLNRQHQLELLSQDVRDVLARLNALAPEEPARLSEDLALLSITGRIYGAQTLVTGPDNNSTTSVALPIQVQISSGQPLAGPAVADQRVYAQNLADTVAARLTEIAGQSSSLQAQILVLQGQLAEASVRQAELSRAQSLAETQYTQLAGRVQEAGLAAQESSNAIQIVSRAAVPSVKVGPQRTVNTLLGGAIGFVFGVLAALGLDAWRKTRALDGRGRPSPAAAAAD